MPDPSPTPPPAAQDARAATRSETRAVRRYLQLIASEPRGGAARARERLNGRLAKVDAALDVAEDIDRLVLLQERIDIRNQLHRLAAAADRERIEADFVAAAAGFGARKGISYEAWREFGVQAKVLSAAGIS